MIEKLKKLRKIQESKALIEASELDYNKDGSVQINVGLKEADDFFSPFSYKTYEFLNPGVEDYIEMIESTIPINKAVTIDIYTETPTTNFEKQRIRKAVKRHQAEQILITRKKLKRKTTTGLMYSALGIFVLILEALLWTQLSNVYLDTLIAVIGWLFLWDGLEILLGDRSSLKRKLIKHYRLLSAKVHVRQYSKKIKREYDLDSDEDITTNT